MWQNVSKEILVGNGETIFSVKVEVENRDKYNEVCEGINLILKGQNCENIKMKQENDRLKADNVKLSALVIKLKDDNDKLKADNERLKNANTNISEMYWEQMNKNIEQKKKIEELEAKHWDECRQIAQYDDELKHVFNEVVSILDSVSAVTANGAKLIRIHENPYKLPTSNADVNCRCSIKPIEKEPSEPENEMTNEEAIQDIQECVKPVCGGKSLDMAVVALKKQVPLKPKSDCIGLPYCPFCCSSIDDDDEFCSNCGQKIDWSDEE